MAKDESPNDLLTITRFDPEDETHHAVVRREAFDKVFKDRGYKDVTNASPAQATEPVEPTSDGTTKVSTTDKKK